MTPPQAFFHLNIALIKMHSITNGQLRSQNATILLHKAYGQTNKYIKAKSLEHSQKYQKNTERGTGLIPIPSSSQNPAMMIPVSFPMNNGPMLT